MQANNELNADRISEMQTELLKWTKCRQNSRNAGWITEMQVEL